MKIRELINDLSAFNQDADVFVNVDGHQMNFGYGWTTEDGDCAECERNITDEKLNCRSVSLFPENRHETCLG